MTFSILIPVYNVENYLPQCLDSVLTQDYDDFEVLLVNDGSTDCSAQICEDYAKKDARIMYLSKPNEGLLLTRRYSLQYAKGDYVLFLDSDDYWEPGLLRTLVNAISNDSSVDMILYRYKRIRDNGKLIYEDKGIFPDRTVFTKENKNVFLKEFVSSSRLNTMWSKCVKRSVVDIDADYTMFKDKKGEDLLQSITLIQNATKILYLDNVLYNYRLSPSGRGRNFKLHYVDSFECVREHVWSKLKDMEVSEDVYEAFSNRYAQNLINFLPSIAGSVTSYRAFVDVIKKMGNFPLFQELSKQTIVKGSLSKAVETIGNKNTRILYFKLIVNNWINKLLREIKHKGEDIVDKWKPIHYDQYRISKKMGGGKYV